MRAVVVEHSGGPDAMRLAELPSRPAGAGQLRVRVEAAGVNPVDASNRADPSWAGVEAPYVVGYEFAGEVIEAREPTDGMAVGDAVWGLLPVRGTRWGAYADEVVCDARLVSTRPPALTVAEAAALPLAGVTAMQLLDRLYPQQGEWLLVHGAAGGVGHLLCQMAHTRGARIAAPASVARHGLLRELGVEVVVDRHDPEAIRLARDLAGGDFAMVADLVGQGRLPASLDVIAEGGRAGTIVELAGDYEEAIDRNVSIHGVLVRSHRAALDALGELVQAGALHVVLDEALPLERAGRAHERVESGSGQGKVVLTV
ncbi:MAG TPA: NADP-dependent oxidoreductase [Gaiellales bacterium]|nr:NADP-dependent oxidoreductase [Gaiellales bacterium]